MDENAAGARGRATTREFFATRLPGETTRVPERRWGAVTGSLVFLVLVPGTVAGAIPFWMTRWRVHPPLLGLVTSRVVGGLLVLVGLASLVESILRFALVGLGTPAPVAPPTRLVVSGQYRLVRNPMYVAVVAIVLGQALLLGSAGLLRYALALWGLFFAFVRLHEEPALRARFGASYEAYCRNVSRWWPRVRPWSG
jgi:protein-S-isoprenylcysteine O-methyltransferase Ste14